MPHKPEPLTAATVKAAKPGRYGDGNGLYLVVKPTKARFWVFRYTMPGAKMREMGLGRAGADLAAVPLAEARKKAAALTIGVRGGIDPLMKRESEAAGKVVAAQAAAAKAVTFKQATAEYIESHKAGWKNAKHASQWANTLAAYAFPYFGSLAVSSVDTTHVLAALQPIWETKTETAGRVRGRIEVILDYAKAHGWRAGENPATWKGRLALALPARSKVTPVEHHPALPWGEIGGFLIALHKQPGIAARALEFAILTAARTGEVLGARWGEVDLQAKLWTVPAVRMKGGREHRVPLAVPSSTLLLAMAKLRTVDSPDAFIFPGAVAGSQLSNMAMAMALRRMKRADLTVHGFRSTFRDWTGENTDTPREVAEAALAHVLGDKTEAAYARSDLFERRRKLMDGWAAFCLLPPLSSPGGP